MTIKFMRTKNAIISILAIAMLASAGCSSAPANEIQTTPNEVQEISAVSEQETEKDDLTEIEQSIDKTEAVNDDPQPAEAIDVTLDDLTPYQIELFKATSISFVESVRDGAMSIDDLVPEHDLIIDTYILMNELPQNARQLFNEWKDSVGYYERLTAWLKGVEEVSAGEIIEPDYSKVDSGVEVTQQTNKPQSSESQVKEQAKDAQERVSGTTTDNSNETVWIDPVTGEVDTHMHSAEEVTGETLYMTFAWAVAAECDLSYEEAETLVAAVKSNNITDENTIREMAASIKGN